MEVKNHYLGNLDEVCKEDIIALIEAEKHYGDSWKKRGGVGAFMMLARKWDRLENQLKSEGYDILEAIEKDGLNKKDGILDDVQDLRRYLILVEAELLARTKQPAS